MDDDLRMGLRRCRNPLADDASEDIDFERRSTGGTRSTRASRNELIRENERGMGGRDGMRDRRDRRVEEEEDFDDELEDRMGPALLLKFEVDFAE